MKHGTISMVTNSFSLQDKTIFFLPQLTCELQGKKMQENFSTKLYQKPPRNTKKAENKLKQWQTISMFITITVLTGFKQ